MRNPNSLDSISKLPNIKTLESAEDLERLPAEIRQQLLGEARSEYIRDEIEGDVLSELESHLQTDYVFAAKKLVSSGRMIARRALRLFPSVRKILDLFEIRDRRRARI
jgi:hypothetical protein